MHPEKLLSSLSFDGTIYASFEAAIESPTDITLYPYFLKYESDSADILAVTAY